MDFLESPDVRRYVMMHLVMKEGLGELNGKEALIGEYALLQAAIMGRVRELVLEVER